MRNWALAHPLQISALFGVVVWIGMIVTTHGYEANSANAIISFMVAVIAAVIMRLAFSGAWTR